MASDLHGQMSDTVLQSKTAPGNVTVQNNMSQSVENGAQNRSVPADCIKVVFSEMEFLPWDNPDNIVSAEVESIVRQIKNNVLVLFFLIGGPANMINIAVFYKQGLKDRVTLCLFALSVADGLHLFNAVLHHGEQFLIQFTTKDRFGPISTVLSNANLVFLLYFNCVSYVLSAIIATERCLCVFYPLKFLSLLSTKTMGAIIIVVYIMVLGLFFIASFRYRVGCVYDPVSDVTVITAVEGEFYSAHKAFIDPLEKFIFGVGLPGGVMIVVMTATIMTTVKLRQTVRWRSEVSSAISAPEVAVTKMLVANSIFFLICLFPFAVDRFSWFISPERNSGRRHHNVFLMHLWIDEIFTYVNATCNIFIYYSMGSRYRETFWALFSRKARLEKR